MKTPKPAVIKVVTTVVTSSLLAQSCAITEYNTANNEYGSFSPNLTKGLNMVDISEINLSDEVVAKIKAVSSIVKEILLNKAEARAFAQNPSSYLAAKELSFHIVLSEDEKAVLMAFSDDDIIEAIKNNNIDSFMELCKERGYIGAVKGNSVEDVKKCFKTEEDYNNFMRSMGGNTPTLFGAPGAPGAGDDGNEGAIGMFVPFPVFVFLIAAIEVVAAAQLYFYVQVSVIGPPGQPGARSIQLQPLNDTEPVIKLWCDNNSVIETDELYKVVVDDEVDKITSITLKHYPEVDEYKLRSVLKLNLEGYYGYRR